MAKRGTLEHPKTKRLSRLLGTVPGVALGVLETIWHWIGEYRKDGGITMNDLEDALDSGGWLSMFSAEAVAAAMTSSERECIWLDLLPDGRMFIHDWHVHADDAVNRSLARAKRYFANGARPDLARLGKDEREALRAHYDSVAFEGCAPNVRTQSALPEPEPEPEPRPRSSCRAEPDEADNALGEVIGYLNEVTGRQYKPASATCSGLRARLRQAGKTGAPDAVARAKLIIDRKLAEWGSDPQMRQYLRPETLFAAGHWDTYSQEAWEWDQEGRPPVRANRTPGRPPAESITDKANRLKQELARGA